MRRLYIICLTLLVMSINFDLKADDGPDGKGIRAGYQNSIFMLDGSKVFDDPLNGFYVGFFRSNNIVPLLKWDSGIEYFQLGGKSGDEELKLHYLSIPLSLKLKLGPVYALGGVNGALKLGGSSDTKEPGTDVSDFSTIDAGAHLGIGFKFLMLGVEARYTWGLVNQTDADFRSEYLQLGAVLFF
ncbi:outer membrane beta-barrel protein [Carboxylicivirga taeanensis]|uniref:outer membrane beta-barrel protein n=1 Tax=Carboxylicivirga taeanensis TaxID=1416875 RepID=UPI003F6DDBC0